MNVTHQIRRIRLFGFAMCVAAGVFLAGATASQPAPGSSRRRDGRLERRPPGPAGFVRW